MARFEAGERHREPVGFDAGRSRADSAGAPPDLRLPVQRPRTLMIWREDVRPAGARTLDPEPPRALTDYGGCAPSHVQGQALAIAPTVTALSPIAVPSAPVRPEGHRAGGRRRPWLLVALVAVMVAAAWPSAFSAMARRPSPRPVHNQLDSRLDIVAIDVLAPAAPAPRPAARVVAPALSRPERRRPRARRHVVWSDEAGALVPLAP
jgi:hypothetical protein